LKRNEPVKEKYSIVKKNPRAAFSRQKVQINFTGSKKFFTGSKEFRVKKKPPQPVKEKAMLVTMQWQTMPYTLLIPPFQPI